MLPEEIDRLAQAVNALRPDWAARDLKTFIANQLPDRGYLAAAKAFAEIATDPTTRSPARILQPGPWWGDKPTAGGGTGGYGPVCQCGKTRPPERVCPNCGGPLPAGHARCTTCKRKAGL